MTSHPFRRLRALTVTVPSAVLLVIGTAVPASAAVTIFGSYVQGDNANDIINVSCAGGVLAAGGDTGDPCAGLTGISVVPSGGTDSVNLSGVTAAAFPALVGVSVTVEESGATPAAADTVFGSPGADTVYADGQDTVNGGDGNDAINGGSAVSGGLGDDTIYEFMGNGTPTGGPGDDRFIQFLGIGGVEGGPGFDSYELDFDRSTPAFGANLALTLGADTLHVLAGPTDAVLPIGGIELVDFTLLRAETQTWNGTNFAGQQRLRGMGGTDLITGGALDDELSGGSGNDTLTGNAGVDLLRGGDGDDAIMARDGVSDRVDCGAGTDTVVADAGDVVAGCESVQLPAVAPPPTPAPVVPGTGAISGKAKVTKPTAAKFRFSSATAGATFQCKVDKGSWKACTSPYKVKTRKLKLGKHTLQVRAVLAGVVDPTPAVKKFKLIR